jgi:hypothetical protein
MKGGIYAKPRRLLNSKPKPPILGWHQAPGDLGDSNKDKIVIRLSPVNDLSRSKAFTTENTEDTEKFSKFQSFSL